LWAVPACDSCLLMAWRNRHNRRRLEPSRLGMGAAFHSQARTSQLSILTHLGFGKDKVRSAGADLFCKVCDRSPIANEKPRTLQADPRLLPCCRAMAFSPPCARRPYHGDRRSPTSP
jgi:hypothetical protein